MKAKKILALALCAVMLVCISVGATVAYLSAQTETVTNTFTVGNVSFDETIGDGLDEADVNEYGKPIKTTKDEEGNDVVTEVPVAEAPRVTENQYKLIPNHTYTKDPTVHMSADTEEAWLFVKVVNGIADIEAESATGTIEAQILTRWDVIDEAKGIYAYKTTVNAGDDLVVFESFTLADGLDEAALNAYATAQNADAQITIQAYAVQADGFDTAAAAWAGAPLAAWNN